MNLTRRKFIQSLVFFASLPLIACHRSAVGLSKGEIMKKYPLKTYSAGRFIIDFPMDIKDVIISQRILGVNIYWLSATENQFNKTISDRIAKLKGFSSDTNLLVSDQPGIFPKSRIIMFEENKRRDGYIEYEAYRYSDEVGGYFILKDSAEREKVEMVESWINEILRMIKPSIIQPEMKTRATFFDHAFISGVDAGIHDYISIMASMDDLTMGFTTQVISRVDDGPSLLQRAEVINGFPEGKLLRKSKREIAGLHGEEFCFIDTPQASSAYSLQWEYKGQANSIAAPRMTASIDSKGPISIPEEELLGLWDVILESIRLRPGAV